MFDDADGPTLAGLFLVGFGAVLVGIAFALALFEGVESSSAEFAFQLIDLVFRLAGLLLTAGGVAEGAKYVISRRDGNDKRARAPGDEASDDDDGGASESQ